MFFVYCVFFCGCLTALHYNITANRRVHVRSPTRKPQSRTQELALWCSRHPAWMRASHGWVNTHSTPVPGLPGSLCVADRQAPQHTTNTTDEPNVHPTRDESLAWSRSHGMRDDGNDVTVNVTEEVPAARPHVEKIAVLMPQILTQIEPQIVKCPVPVPQETVLEVVREAD